jgi:putative hydrolase of the HAD superfamily
LIRAVISDFGGVLTTPLLDSFIAYQRESGIAFEDLGAALAGAAAAHGGEHPLFALEKGEITEAEFIGRLEEQLGRKMGSFRETYFAHLHPNQRMIDYMRELKGRGLRMALLTNNVREWEPHWRAKLPDIDEIFEVVVDSAFVGMRKPERRIYELTLERLDGVPAGDCLFLDDIDANCEAAAEVGMQVVRFEDNDRAIADIDAILDREGVQAG